MYVVAYNQCKNEYRKNTLGRIKRDNYAKDSSRQVIINPSFERDFDFYSFSECLENELQKMDDKHGLTFVLRHQEGLTIKEIGVLMQCSEGTVKSRLFYAIEKLAKKLRQFKGRIENS
ncbi:sigma-70 family RNA polymerase sigma factor [uncultured Kriegella sp.]|uniref:RNA polymerase sigma factor n=1 Tax=uncultured Kriegella sp. TaxID=1798910 RepID=UPI0030DCBD5B